MSEVIGVVLAAGLGTRLRPSTLWCPKPLIPVAGLEPLFVAISQARSLGIKKILVNAHHLSEHIINSLNEWKSIFHDVQLRVSVESGAILGTGGALIKMIRENQDWFSGNGLLLQNGDTLGCFSFNPLTEDLFGKSRFAVSCHEDFLKKYHPLWMNPQNFYWTGIGSTNPTGDSVSAHFLGVHYLCVNAVEQIFIKEDLFPERSVDLFNGIYRPLTEAGLPIEGVDVLGGVDAFSDKSFWFDMTNEKFLLEAQAFIFDHLKTGNLWHRMLMERFPDLIESAPRTFVAKGVQLPAVSLKAPVLIAGAGDFRPDSNLIGSELGPYLSVVSRRIRDLPSLLSERLSRASLLIHQQRPIQNEQQRDEISQVDVRVI